MPIDELWDLFADLTNLYELVEEIRAVLASLTWGIAALLDLFLHAGWALVAATAGLLLAYWLARGLYWLLGGRINEGLDYIETRRAILICVLVQFLMDVLGHAHAVFRQGLPVTLQNLAQHAARDFHNELWMASLIAFGTLALWMLFQIVRKSEGVGGPIRWVAYSGALFATLSSHMWWDRLLFFGGGS